MFSFSIRTWSAKNMKTIGTIAVGVRVTSFTDTQLVSICYPSAFSCCCQSKVFVQLFFFFLFFENDHGCSTRLFVFIRFWEKMLGYRLWGLQWWLACGGIRNTVPCWGRTLACCTWTSWKRNQRTTWTRCRLPRTSWSPRRVHSGLWDKVNLSWGWETDESWSQEGAQHRRDTANAHRNAVCVLREMKTQEHCANRGTQVCTWNWNHLRWQCLQKIKWNKKHVKRKTHAVIGVVTKDPQPDSEVHVSVSFPCMLCFSQDIGVHLNTAAF